MDIFLSDRAFVGITIASIEVYANECLGSLLGYRTPNRVVVEHALVYQSAKRKPREVEPNWKRESKVRDTIMKLIQMQPLGYFHSHTQWGEDRAVAELSDADKESMKPGEIEIVVAINKARRRTPWYRPTQEQRDLCGSIGKYHVRMAGFYKRKRDGKIKQYTILCPYVMGFDYTFV